MKRGGEHDDGAETGNPAAPAPEGEVEEAACEGSAEAEVTSLPPRRGGLLMTEADGALVAPPDFKSGREAEMSLVGSIPSRFRQALHPGDILKGDIPISSLMLRSVPHQR